MEKTLVVKFGGASVKTPECFANVAERIVERKNPQTRIVVVVSAMGNTTNDLLDLAKAVHPDAPRREVDMLISVGERISISLLAMALARKNCPAISLTGSQSGIITSGEHSEAKIIEVRPKRILEGLNQNKVVIVAGFQGVSTCGEITTLGRGGSDTSAVALAVALQAAYVEFFKDVGGIYEEDPKVKKNAAKISWLDYHEMKAILEGGAKVLHKRALWMAEQNTIPLHVTSFAPGSSVGTIISAAPDMMQKELWEAPVFEKERTESWV